MKKILKELIDNFPELEKNKEDIEKAVYYLKDNKPVFSASKEFKKNLKNRLKNIASIKSQKKSSFLVFAVPVFSFLFIVAGFSYYFKQINFLNDVNNISVGLYDIDSLEKEGLILKETNKIFDENVSNKQIESSSIINDAENIDNLSLKDYNEKSNIKISQIANNNLLDEDKKTSEIVINNNDFIKDNLYENDDINSLLGIIGEMYPESGDGFKNEKTMPYIGAARGGFENDIMMMKTNSFYMLYDEEYMSFEDYCLTNSGSILQNEKAKLCRVKQKYCLSSDYINGVCEFKEIK